MNWSLIGFVLQRSCKVRFSFWWGASTQGSPDRGQVRCPLRPPRKGQCQNQVGPLPHSAYTRTQLTPSSQVSMHCLPSCQGPRLQTSLWGVVLWLSLRGVRKRGCECFLALNGTALIKFLFLPKLHCYKWHNGFEVRHIQTDHHLWIWPFWFVSSGAISERVETQRL